MNVRARADIQIIKHGLHIPPSTSSYEDFVSKIKKNEADFVNGIGISHEYKD